MIDGRAHITWLIRLASVCFLFTSPVAARQVDDSLAAALETHVASGNLEAVDTSIASRRLDVKPIVDAWIGQGIRAGLAGDDVRSEALLATAATVADRFERTFGERSLSTAVAYVQGWSPDERRIKQRADSLAQSGLDKRSSGDLRPEALADYAAALDLYRDVGDRRGEAEVLGAMGYISFFLDRPRYLEYNLEALDVRTAVDDRQLMGNAHSDVALGYRLAGDLDRALEHYEQARAIREEIGDVGSLGRQLSAMGRLYEQVGEYESAVDAYRESGRLLESVGDFSRAADALQLAGLSLSDYFGRHSDAVLVLEEARRLRDRGGDTEGLVGTLNNTGIINRRLGNLDGAVEAYQEVIRLSRELGDDLGIARASNNIGVVFLWAERPDRAATYFERAYRQFEALGDTTGMLDAVVNTASSLFESRDYDAALPYGRTALDMAHAEGEPITEVSATILLGNILAYRGESDEARALYATALGDSRSLGIPDLEFNSLLSLGEFHERFGEPDSALAYYDRAFETLEALRSLLSTEEDKAGFLAQQRYAYESVIHFLTKRNREDPDGGYAAAAFGYAERGKARAFLDLLAEALSDVREGVSDELRARRSHLLEAMAQVRRTLVEGGGEEDAVALRDSLDGLETSYADLERALRTQNPRYSELQYPEPSSLAETQALLPVGTALFEYSLGDSSSTLWAVTREGTRMYMLPPRDSIREQVDLLRFALADPTRGSAASYAATAHVLYSMVLGPAESTLDETGTLVIVPDGELSYVPFEALVRTPVEDPAYADLPYLVRSHQVAYAPSASVLETLMDEPDGASYASSGLVAFGDPVFTAERMGEPMRSGDPTADLARLPYTGDEVRAIGRLFPEDQVTIYVRDDASEARITDGGALSGYRYVHFATHGLINEDRPDFSGLALTASAEASDDGFLQVAEIFNLHLDADLVVLSACETGLGRMVRGEGLLGLTRAFLYAGASSLVVSLWSVADRSTSELMQRFYSALVADGASKSDALRTAKLSMLQDPDLAHPFSWAPFTLTGKWK